MFTVLKVMADHKLDAIVHKTWDQSALLEQPAFSPALGSCQWTWSGVSCIGFWFGYRQNVRRHAFQHACGPDESCSIFDEGGEIGDVHSTPETGNTQRCQMLLLWAMKQSSRCRQETLALCLGARAIHGHYATRRDTDRKGSLGRWRTGIRFRRRSVCLDNWSAVEPAASGRGAHRDHRYRRF
jgi:hypothetical protein